MKPSNRPSSSAPADLKNQPWLTRLLLLAVVLALVGLVMLVIGFLVDARRAYAGYLVAYAYMAGIAFGALVFLMIGHAMNAVWPVAVRRVTETIAGTMPLFLVLLIPILVGVGELYSWVSPPADASHRFLHAVEFKRPYLNVPFFIVRSIAYVLLWTVGAFLLRRWSLRQDATLEARFSFPHRLSAGLLPFLGITSTFAAYDWLMSLSPVWYSSIFGLYYFAGGFVGNFAFIILLTALLVRRGVLLGITGSHYYALGRLLFAFTVFWAYCAFFQVFLIWAANKPDEVFWYIDRIQGAWRYLAAVVVVGHFVIPFIFLLSYHLKRRARPLVLLALLLLVMHYLDLYWVTMPSLYPHFAPHWVDLGALLFVGGLAQAYALWILRRHPPLPVGDPRLPAALGYHST